MTAEDKKGNSGKPISEDQRFKFIGFDVFPGKPKDLFKSDAEKTKHENAVKAKREKGDIIRDECTLLETRVSFFDRIVLTIACLVIFTTLFVPWFSTYNEVVEETQVAEQVEDVAGDALVADSSVLADMTDSLGALVANTEESAAEVIDSASALAATEGEGGGAEFDPLNEVSGEEVLHGYIAKKKYTKHYSRLAGYGVFASIGSVGSYVFSSGIILIITGIFFLLHVLLVILLPAYTLYGVFGLKGNEDQKALALKKVLKFNWIPLLLFVASLIISFIGAEYGFDSQAVFTSLGIQYGPGVFFDSLSYGPLVSLAAFILLAIKGVEI